jgi:hypothetical protein
MAKVSLVTAMLAMLALVSACASAPPEDASRIDYDRAPPADWPLLELVVHDVDQAAMAEACPAAHGRLAGKLFSGCARLDFCARRCDVFLAYRPASIRRTTGEVLSAEQLRAEALDHEQAHCLGYDHPGSTMVRDAWARAKAAGCGRSRSF